MFPVPRLGRGDATGGRTASPRRAAPSAVPAEHRAVPAPQADAAPLCVSAEIFSKVQKQKQSSSQSSTVSLGSESPDGAAPAQAEKRPCCVAI